MYLLDCNSSAIVLISCFKSNFTISPNTGIPEFVLSLPIDFCIFIGLVTAKILNLGKVAKGYFPFFHLGRNYITGSSVYRTAIIQFSNYSCLFQCRSWLRGSNVNMRKAFLPPFRMTIKCTYNSWFLFYNALQTIKIHTAFFTPLQSPITTSFFIFIHNILNALIDYSDTNNSSKPMNLESCRIVIYRPVQELLATSTILLLIIGGYLQMPNAYDSNLKKDKSGLSLFCSMPYYS